MGVVLRVRLLFTFPFSPESITWLRGTSQTFKIYNPHYGDCVLIERLDGSCQAHGAVLFRAILQQLTE